MSKEDKIEFDPNSLPQRIDVTVNGEDFTLRLRYNDVSDAYYMDVYDDVGVRVVAGEKVVYKEILFANVTDPRLPTAVMIPYDEPHKETEVDFANFQRSVFIFLPTDSSTDPDDAALLAQSQFGVDDEEDVTPDVYDDDEGEESSPYGTDETVDDILR